MNKFKGFTLIEMIVVISILGMLLTMLVPNVITYRENAERQALHSDAKVIYSSIRNTISDNPKFFNYYDETNLSLKKNLIVSISEYTNTHSLASFIKLVYPSGTSLNDVVVTEYGQWQIIDLTNVKGHGIEATFIIKTMDKKNNIIEFTMNKKGIEEN